MQAVGLPRFNDVDKGYKTKVTKTTFPHYSVSIPVTCQGHNRQHHISYVNNNMQVTIRLQSLS